MIEELQIEQLEKGLLGLFLSEPELIDRAGEILKSDAVWAGERAQLVWRILRELRSRGEGIDHVVVRSELAKRGQLKRVGGDTYLSELLMGATTSANLESYCRVLTEVAMLRKLRLAAQKVLADTAELKADPFDITASLERELESVAGLSASTGTITIGEAVGDAERILRELTENPEGSALLRFGYADLDRLMGGMMKGNFIVIGGKDKSGKTTLSLQVMFFNARLGAPFALFTPGDMTAGEVLLRQAFIEARVSLLKAMNEEMNQDEYERVKDAFRKLKALPVYINDRAYQVEEIAGEIARLVKEKKIRGAVIDYLQQVTSSGSSGGSRREESREREVAHVSRTLKRVAKRHGIVVIAQSQLNEEMKSRESRAIQQDADKLIFLDAHEDEPMPYGEHYKTVDLKIKQRLGPSGTFGDVRLLWDTTIGTFENYTERTAPPSQAPAGPKAAAGPVEEEEEDLKF